MVHNELAFLRGRTELRAIAAVVLTRPGLGGISGLRLALPPPSKTQEAPSEKRKVVWPALSDSHEVPIDS